jgi:hypothetical protein
MVHYMANHHAVQEAHVALEEPQPPDLMMAELAAMQTIATALTGLRDEQARLRVLRWADGFSAAPGSSPSPSDAQLASLEPAMQSRRQDTTLTLDGFDLFGDAVPEKPAPMTPRTADGPLDLMIKGLVADVQQIARDWHGE